LKPSQIETDERNQKSMRKSISVPPQIYEVASNRRAEQDERDSQSKDSQQPEQFAEEVWGGAQKRSS
jgi:hypothetical protein